MSMASTEQEKIGVILKEYGYKVTPTRIAVLSTLMRIHTPLSADALWRHVEKKHRTDPVTIYRTLASFEQKGLIKKIHLRTDVALYELVLHHHHHIICTSCGHIEDFSNCSIGHMIDKVLNTSSKFKTITDHSVELFGMCTSCTK